MGSDMYVTWPESTNHPSNHILVYKWMLFIFLNQLISGGVIDRRNAYRYIKRNYHDDLISRVDCEWPAEIVEPVWATG